MPSVLLLQEQVGTKAACAALDLPRATFYRHQQQPKASEESTRPTPPLALSAQEKQTALDALHSERFCDLSPYQVYATLLDEGTYLCSIKTFYRLLAARGEVKDRRRQTSRCHYQKPELLATAPNQVWSWDITKLKGPVKWSYFHLYVIMDIFSRCVVGWMVAHREQAALAKQLINETCQKHNIQAGQLTIHADRGSSMKSKTVAQLMGDLGITKTHSRPHVSNDNPYSEAQFKTLKYCPSFPRRFGSLADARAFCQDFFQWYNNEHKHSGIALLTPAQVHYHEAEDVLRKRSAVLVAAFGKNPARFKGKIPRPTPLPEAAWINPPPQKDKSLFAGGENHDGVPSPSAPIGSAGIDESVKAARVSAHPQGLALTDLASTATRGDAPSPNNSSSLQ